MTTSLRATDVRAALEAAWTRTDALFDLLEDAWTERPIPLRHPFVFYLGHLPAFAWNQVGRGVLGRGPREAKLDELFERGIDPADEEAAADVAIEEWPELDAILAYRDDVRRALRELAGELEDEEILHVVLEHELMHHETLVYALQQLPLARKRVPAGLAPPELGAAPERETVLVPGGEVTLGADPGELEFGWDNELPRRVERVADFRLDRWPVPIRDYREFVEAGGYGDETLWAEDDWRWIRAQGIEHPLNWRRSGASGNGFVRRTMFGELPLDAVAGWPVIVSHAEASAYARWRGARLPSEAELHRAARGAPDGTERSYPWGDDAPRSEHGNFGFASWDPVPVGARPAGRSAFGIEDLVGNGWQWTDTPFVAHPGFEVRHPTYPGYSADFFDGDHRVLFGAAWPTSPRLLRPTFRNWFQRHYPYAFTAVRLAGDA